MLAEGSLGATTPPEPGISAAHLSFPADARLGHLAGHRRARDFDPLIFARWRCWSRPTVWRESAGAPGERGTGNTLGISQTALVGNVDGGNPRWEDGRNTPAMFTLPCSSTARFRLTCGLAGSEFPEMYRFQGSKGVLETDRDSDHTPKAGADTGRAITRRAFRVPCARNISEMAPGARCYAWQGASVKVYYCSVSWDEEKPHLWNYFQAAKTRKPVVEDAVFGHHAALACQMSNQKRTSAKAR